MNKAFTKFGILMLGLLLLAQADAQVSADVHRAYAKVYHNGQQLKYPWAGGLNNPQVSPADLNNDGREDLFIYERAPLGFEGSILTFINTGTDYVWAPEYTINFPSSANFMLLRDYNCDGIADIYAFSPPSIGIASGVMVWRGYYDANNRIAFTRVVDDIYFPFGGFQNNLLVSNDDIPTIADLDGDGDLDILNFSGFGSWVDYFENQSAEMGYGCDSLIYRLKDDCWGRFYENPLDNNLTFSNTIDSCAGRPNWVMPPRLRHAGSTITSFDIDNDNDHEVFIGDINYNNIVMGLNTGNRDTAFITSEIFQFPDYDVEVDLLVFPAAYFLDVTHDGHTDMLVAPNARLRSENVNCLWLYENVQQTPVHQFELNTRSFLVGDMIDHGMDAAPVFFDHNRDGLLDIVVGHYAYNLPNGNKISQLLLYENTGTATEPEFTLVDGDYAGLSQIVQVNFNAYVPTFGDLDNDGDEDMLVGKEDGQLLFLRNTGGTGTAQFTTAPEPNWEKIDVVNKAAPQLVDLNRDGKLDLIIGNKTGYVQYFQNTGTLLSPEFSSVTSGGVAVPTTQFLGNIDMRRVTFNQGWASPKFKEINGDPYLFVGNFFGDIVQFDGIYSLGNNIASTFTVIDSSFGDIYVGFHSAFDLADINADGKMDYVVGSENGGLQLYSEGFLDTVSTVNIQLPAPSMAFNIFPNPSAGGFYIDLIQAPTADTQVEVYNTLGQLQYQAQLNKQLNYLPLEQLAEGAYVVMVRSGVSVQSRKVLIRR